MATGHRSAELRSLAFHRTVAERLDDALLDHARARVARWNADGGPVHPVWAGRWLELLDQPRDEIVRVLSADDQRSRDLRQNTPFAGALTPRERWQIVRNVG